MLASSQPVSVISLKVMEDLQILQSDLEHSERVRRWLSKRLASTIKNLEVLHEVNDKKRAMHLLEMYSNRRRHESHVQTLITRRRVRSCTSIHFEAWRCYVKSRLHLKARISNFCFRTMIKMSHKFLDSWAALRLKGIRINSHTKRSLNHFKSYLMLRWFSIAKFSRRICSLTIRLHRR